MLPFATRKDPVTGNRVVNIAGMVDLIRAFGLVIVVIAVSLGDPGPGTPGPRGTGIAVTLGLSAAGWLGWVLSGTTGQRRALSVGGLIVMGGAGGVLTGLAPNGPAIAVVCAAAFSAGVRMQTGASLAIVAEAVAAFEVAALASNEPTGVVLGFPFAFAGFWSMALTRREYLVRAEQAERTLAETRRAREAETHAAALAERARIARDIHDVLAHSLAAVSVNLQAAEGLLASDTLPADNPELAKAIQCISRAGTLTRDGLAAAKRAVLALRDDAEPPLPDQLAALTEQFRTVGDPAVTFEVSGEDRPVPAEVSQAVYRTAQEALTNARKHSPGQPVTIGLGYEPDEITLSVVNPMPPEDAASPLADTGGGFGLVGLTERAALAGGAFEAGPDAGSWRVNLRIPA